MPTLIADPWSRIIPRTQWTVWVKPYWASEWVWLPYLEFVKSDEQMPPGDSTADFVWRYGPMYAQELGEYTLFTPYDINNWYIAVMGHRPEGWFYHWIGVLKTEAFDLGAVRADSPVFGDQHMQAVGLESLLKRGNISGSMTVDGWIDRTLPLNERYSRGFSPCGNRSATVGPDGCFVFGGTDEWTALQFLEYVLTYHFPTAITWIITGETGALEDLIPTGYKYEGDSPWDVLNHFASPHRALGWKLWTDGVNEVEIQVGSTSAQPVSVAGVVAQGAQNGIVIDFADYIEVQPRILSSNLAKYDSVKVWSEKPVMVCFTASFANGRLEKAWTDDEEAAYLAATDDERQEERFHRVFTTFRIVQDMDWTGILPTTDEFGGVDFSAPSPLHLVDKRFERTVPFEETAAITGAQPRFRKMIALIQHETAYCYVDKLSALDVRGAQDCAAGPGDREMTIVVNGNPNHLLALNHFGEAESDTDPLFDYETLVVTVFLEADCRLFVNCPLWGGVVSETGEVKNINAPGIEYWYVAPNTVVDVQGGALEYYNEGAASVVRDDSGKLLRVAAQACAYYGEAVSPMEYALTGIIPIHPVGTLVLGAVSGWHAQPIGSIVTQRETLAAENKLIVRTGHRNLDFRPENVA